jgi:hypothetical protein
MLTGNFSGKSPILMRGLVVVIASACMILAAGCGVNSNSISSQSIEDTVTGVRGVVHGGQSPIQGATVNLYVTSSSATGYGQAATLIGTSPTDVNGVFTISPSATTTNCPSGQQAYITAAGGYPSGSSSLANTSTLMMAALGDCAHVSASTNVIINEVTTVAAAYALSGFMTTSGSGTTLTANVSAPPANSAAIGTLTTAAGLPHAFLNAANLATYATGTANSATAALSVGGLTNNVTGKVPLAEINTLGNILAGCVNGVTGNAQCVSLFGFTPSISGVAPTNTLQSMINLARNPYPSAAAMNATTGLFSLAGAVVPFPTALTANPPDWSLAIVYNPGTLLPAQYFIALDADDTVYAGASASANLAALSPYGTATPAYTAGSVGTATRQIAPDALGNVWVTGYKASSTTTDVYQYSAIGGGAPSSTNSIALAATASEVYGVAVDKSNNVWIANSAAVTPNIIEYAYSGGTWAANYTATVPTSFQPVALTIDASQNIWAAPYYTNANIAMVLANLTPSSTATYTTSGTTVTPIYNTFASSGTKPLGLAIDASGNAWYGIVGPSNSLTTTGIEEVIPTLTSSVITSLSPQTLITGTTLDAWATGIPEIDGAGTLYLSDNLSSTELTGLGIHVYSTVSTTTSSNTGGQVLSPPSGYLGCYLATAATTACGPVGGAYNSAVYNPRNAVVDSTGSVWAGITSGGFTQLVGLGAPSWPLLQTGKPGLSPGSSTVTPLP